MKSTPSGIIFKTQWDCGHDCRCIEDTTSAHQVEQKSPKSGIFGEEVSTWYERQGCTAHVYDKKKAHEAFVGFGLDVNEKFNLLRLLRCFEVAWDAGQISFIPVPCHDQCLRTSYMLQIYVSSSLERELVSTMWKDDNRDWHFGHPIKVKDKDTGQWTKEVTFEDLHEKVFPASKVWMRMLYEKARACHRQSEVKLEMSQAAQPDPKQRQHSCVQIHATIEDLPDPSSEEMLQRFRAMCDQFDNFMERFHHQDVVETRAANEPDNSMETFHHDAVRMPPASAAGARRFGGKKRRIIRGHSSTHKAGSSAQRCAVMKASSRVEGDRRSHFAANLEGLRIAVASRCYAKACSAAFVHHSMLATRASCK
eukprot:5445798-Amphidinium_carterae.1